MCQYLQLFSTFPDVVLSYIYYKQVLHDKVSYYYWLKEKEANNICVFQSCSYYAYLFSTNMNHTFHKFREIQKRSPVLCNRLYWRDIPSNETTELDAEVIKIYIYMPLWKRKVMGFPSVEVF